MFSVSILRHANALGTYPLFSIQPTAFEVLYSASANRDMPIVWRYLWYFPYQRQVGGAILSVSRLRLANEVEMDPYLICAASRFEML